MDDVATILLVILAIAALWVLIKFAARLGVKIFTCGCLLIIIGAVVIILMRFVEIPAF